MRPRPPLHLEATRAGRGAAGTRSRDIEPLVERRLIVSRVRVKGESRSGTTGRPASVPHTRNALEAGGSSAGPSPTSLSRYVRVHAGHGLSLGRLPLGPVRLRAVARQQQAEIGGAQR